MDYSVMADWLHCYCFLPRSPPCGGVTVNSVRSESGRGDVVTSGGFSSGRNGGCH